MRNQRNINKLNKYRQERQISGFGENVYTSKYDKGTTPTPDQGEEYKEINTGNRTGNKSFSRTELVHIHTSNIYFKGDTPEVGSVLGLMSKKLYIGTSFDNFREKLKGYMERNFDNTKYVLCVVTYMEDTMKTFE